uniref:acetyl-CoA C-acyltransferase n=1 Tax=Blastobotrys adeninivorans TaxID=409370 RepID=A0A060TEE1_BLAAD
MERASNLASQLGPNPTSNINKYAEKRPDDVVITAAYRTAIAKGRKGSFKDMDSSEVLAGLFKGLFEKSNLDPALIQDVVVGNVRNPGAGVTEHRAAALYAGIPAHVPFQAVNRLCSSGLVAVNDVANKIIAGQIDIGIGAGAESMTKTFDPKGTKSLPKIFQDHPEASKCSIPMGITSENVADRYNISRREQDEFAAHSFEKAAKAQDAGLFEEEILPITARVINPKTNTEETTVVSKDEGIRRGVTADSLGRLKPSFRDSGSTHAGNASQVSDGAAAVVLMRRSVAEKLGQPILAKYVHTKVVGVDPAVMGIGPGIAIPALLEELGLTNDDIDIFEINEAFASQAIWSIKHAKIPLEKVNPKGGAIAFGHPLGATGARQIATLLPELKRTGKRVGITSMCVGTGMGAAALFIRE